MKTRGWRMEEGGGTTRGGLDCGGKSDATPLWEPATNLETTGNHRPWKSASASDLPAQSKTWRTFLAFCLLTSALCLPAFSQSYSIDWHTIDGGGGTSTGGVYSVSGTIGQPDAGAMSGGNFSVTGGFWSLFAVQTPGAPTLTIVPAAPGNATISWTPATAGYLLQENLDLTMTNWVNSPSGATNPIVVPTTLPTKFYRLLKP